MISYRKLAMRVLGHSPVSAVKTARRSTAKRTVALALTAALVVGMTLPAFAGTWYIENGDISISAGENGNKVTQGGKTKENDTDTVITNRDSSTASSNTVTIDADEGKTVNVTLDNVTINVDEGYKYGYDPNAYKTAVSVTGSGNTNIELNGNNTLTSGYGHAGLEHNKTDDSGTLTIQDEKNDDGSAKGSASDTTGSLTATGGYHSAGIGGSDKQDGQVTITGGEIIANGGSQGAGIGGGAGNQNAVGGDGDVTISGGTITATGGSLGAGIGGGAYGNGTVTVTDGDITAKATGNYGAGIGGGFGAIPKDTLIGGNGTVTISGGTITAAGSDGAAGIGGGYYNGATVTITGDAVIKNASSTKYGAGIGGGNGSDGNVTISGNAKIENATGGYGAAGIGGGAFSSPDKIGNGNVVIKDNAKIDNVQGGAYGAGIGGGIYGLSNVTIEGNTKVNATGGAGGAAIGGGAGAENNSDNNGNQITIKSNENGSPTINAVGGGTDEGEKIVIGGAGIGAGCESDADADITLEGKVTITATAGKDNVAIGANGIEQEFSGLAEGSSITRYDSEGNDITLPTDPVPAVPSSSGGSSADASVQESVFPGLVVTDKDGQRISYTSIRDNNVLSLRVGRFTASLRASLATLRQLRAEGIDTITFQTILCSTTLSVDELLAMGGEDTEVVLTHHIRSSTLTVGGKAV